jgi:hypothetical protein
MHRDRIDAALAARLVAAQFPDWPTYRSFRWRSTGGTTAPSAAVTP